MIFDNIRSIADKRGVSLTNIEKEAGLANGLIGKWRTTTPRVDNLLAVARVLDVPLDALLSASDEYRELLMK